MARVAIRADGGISVGMGHIMRCLSLAKAFRENGHYVYFFSKYDMGIKLIEKENLNVIQMPFNNEETEGFFYGNSKYLVDEVIRVIDLLHRYKIDILVVDSYNVTEEYFLTLKPHISKLVYIDDENKFAFPVDVVINGNVTAKRLGYKKYSEHQLLLLGPQYNMIREEFKNISRRIIKEKAEQIMITTGGSDPYDITGKLVSILLKADCFRNIRINILVGAGFTNHRKLIEDFHNYEQVVFYSNMIEDKSMPFVYSSISNLMLQSDIAMSSGGSTLYEFAACGTPVLAFIMAENQKFLVETMEQLGCVINLGWYNQINEIKLIDMTNQLMNDYVAKVRMSSKCKGIVDALGTERIVKKLTIG